MHRRKGRPNLLDDEFLVKVKDVVTGARMTGEVISRKMVIATGTGVKLSIKTEGRWRSHCTD